MEGIPGIGEGEGNCQWNEQPKLMVISGFRRNFKAKMLTKGTENEQCGASVFGSS